MSEQKLWLEQSKPTANKHPAVWDLVRQDLEGVKFPDSIRQSIVGQVIEDSKLRDETGENKYGVRLQPFNGRNALQDAYEEMLDAIVYLRSAIYEETENRVVTEERKMKIVSLIEAYHMQTQLVMGIKHILNMEKGIYEQQSSIIIPGNN